MFSLCSNIRFAHVGVFTFLSLFENFTFLSLMVLFRRSWRAQHSLRRQELILDEEEGWTYNKKTFHHVFNLIWTRCFFKSVWMFPFPFRFLFKTLLLCSRRTFFHDNLLLYARSYGFCCEDSSWVELSLIDMLLMGLSLKWYVPWLLLSLYLLDEVLTLPSRSKWLGISGTGVRSITAFIDL